MNTIVLLRKVLLLFSLLLILSCGNDQKETPPKKKTPVIKKDSVTQKNPKTVKKETSTRVENPMYIAADRLNVVLFGKKLKYLDFNTSSDKIPGCAAIFDFKELINIRAFKEPNFTKSKISNYIDNYVYIIFEYPTKEIAQKILKQYANEAEIMDKIDTSEIPFETLSARQKQIFYNSKHGGIIFNSNQNLIFVKEDCNEPKTKIPMQWSTYEKVFLNSFGHHIQDSIVGTGCGFTDWSMYTRK